MTVENAYKIYLDLLEKQNDLFEKKSLESLRRESGDVEEQFKNLYNHCYTKFIKNNIIYY